MLLLNDGKDNYGCFSNIGVKAIKENVLLLRYEQKRFLKKSPLSHHQFQIYLILMKK